MLGIATLTGLWVHEIERHHFVGSIAIAMSVLLSFLLGWCGWMLARDWERARVHEQWLETTLRSIGDAVVSADREGRITLMNTVAQELTGWTEEEALGRPIEEVMQIIRRDSGTAVESVIERIVRENKQVSFSMPIRLVARDGTERAIADSAAPLHDAGGRVIGGVVVFRDITEKELGEAALYASQSMFRLITDHSSDLIAVVDLQGRALYRSRSYSRVTGTPATPAASEPFADVHPEDRDRVGEVFAETIRAGTTQRIEYRLVRTDGTAVHVESVGSVIQDAAGNPEKVLLVLRDITDRRMAQDQIRQEKEFSDSLINSMPGIFYLYDWRRKLLRWNKNLETVSGYTTDEIHTIDPLDFFLPEQQPIVHQRMLQCFAEGCSDVEVFLGAKAGRRTPFFVTGVRVKIGHDPCMLGVGIDISERVEAEETSRGTMRRLGRQNKALAEQAHRPALSGTDPSDAFREITELAARTLEVRRASIWLYSGDQSQMHCVELFDTATGEHSSGEELDATLFPRYFAALKSQRAIAAKDAATDERTSELTSGYLESFGITSMLDAPIHSGGRMVGVFCNEHTGPPRDWAPDEQNFAGSLADLVSLNLQVAQRRKAEEALREAHRNLEIKVAQRTKDLEKANEQLREANERLTELDRLKSEFVAMMSHELRTPLNSIIGFTGILRQNLAGPLNGEQSKQLGMVHFSAKHLLGLINDLLDLSRIESGKMETECESFALEALVQNVVETLQPLVAQKRLALETFIEPPQLAICSDRKKVFQILLNLANNAVKFTEHGRVEVRVSADPEVTTLEVIDTGIGIKPQSMENLFQAFRQVDGSARRVYEGTGLGLYLCQKLVSMLGGHIRAESEFGAGSRFTVTLPREIPTPPQA